MFPIHKTYFCAGMIPPWRAVELMTFFTRAWATNTPFIDPKMEDTKYHGSHFKLIGFPLSRTFLNIILSRSLKASWSSYLNPFVWLERAYWYSMAHSYQVKTGLCDLANDSIEADKQCQHLTGQIVTNVVQWRRKYWLQWVLVTKKAMPLGALVKILLW